MPAPPQRTYIIKRLRNGRVRETLETEDMEESMALLRESLQREEFTSVTYGETIVPGLPVSSTAQGLASGDLAQALSDSSGNTNH
jgi:hypothetical protein